MKRFLLTICLLLGACAIACAATTADNLIPKPKQIKYLSQRRVKLKSVDIKVIPSEGAPSEQYTLTTKRGKAIIVAQSKQARIGVLQH